MRFSRLLAASILLWCVLLTPALYGQQDVHAVLVAQAARKPAPTFHLADEAGKTMQIADYKGKVVLPYPATYLIDKSGKIAGTYVGVVNKENVEQNLKALLLEH
jgi:peroxiredoxin